MTRPRRLVKSGPKPGSKSPNPKGRPKGIKETKPRTPRTAFNAIVDDQRARYTTDDPKEYFQQVLRDPNMPTSFKEEAAKALIPYTHQKKPIAIEGTERPIPVINAGELARMGTDELKTIMNALKALGVTEAKKEDGDDE